MPNQEQRVQLASLADGHSASSYSTAVEGGTPVRIGYTITGRLRPETYLPFIADRAVWLDVAGWVTIRDDGAVELVACGPEALVGALEMAAMLGPLDALIDRIETTSLPDAVVGPFAIR